MSDAFGKILVVQQKMIGDVLTSTILLEALRKKYPNAKLHYLVNSHTVPVVENNPFIDKLVLFTPEMEKSKLVFFRLLQKIRKEKYDVVIDVYSKFSSALICCFSGAKKTIGKKKWYLTWAYSKPIVPSSKRGDLQIPMAYINRFDFLKPIVDKIDYGISPKIHLTEIEKKSVGEKLQKHQVAENPIMVNCLGSSMSKTYPLKYMARVLDELIAFSPEKTLLLNFMPSQKKEAEILVSLCNGHTQNTISNYHAANLRELIVLISFCQAVIGNEGGATNIAKALDIPTFAIFSPWIAPESWGHKNDPRHVNIDLKQFRPELFSGRDKKYIKKHFQKFYKAFKPSLFIENLRVFFKTGA